VIFVSKLSDESCGYLEGKYGDPSSKEGFGAGFIVTPRHLLAPESTQFEEKFTTKKTDIIP
jgi:hypothetical protein